jgi:hypothetical protein
MAANVIARIVFFILLSTQRKLAILVEDLSRLLS